MDYRGMRKIRPKIEVPVINSLRTAIQYPHSYNPANHIASIVKYYLNTYSNTLKLYTEMPMFKQSISLSTMNGIL